MLEILEQKLAKLNYNLNNDIIAEEGLSFMLGQQELLMDLISECSHIEFRYDPQEPYEYSYDDEYCDYHNDFESRYYDDLAYYKQQEIDNMYNTHYHYSWWIGKNIMSTDSYWFTSDEVDAFKIIWQRRISAM